MSDNRLAFWSPVVIPVGVGLLLAFAELAVDLGGSSQGIRMFRDLLSADNEYGDNSVLQEQFMAFIWIDINELWMTLVKSLGISVFAIDIWALTVLFASRAPFRASTIYAYPVIGVFAHFVLLLLIVGTVEVAAGFEDLQDQENIIAIAWKLIASIATFLAILVGYWVRRGIWVHYETIED